MNEDGWKTPNSPRKPFRRARATLIVVVVIGALLSLSWVRAASSTKTFILAMVDFALHGKNENYNILGDVGGAPFSIPRSVAKWVEYDDKAQYEKDRKALPDNRTRTVKDKLASFGFTAHFPDMELETSEVRKRERERGEENMYTTTWIDVGIHSHSAYLGGALGLERQVSAIPDALVYRGTDFVYQRQTELVHGLIAYRPVQKITSPDGAVSWKAIEDQSLFYHLDNSGKVDAYIQCSFVKHAASPCTHRFLMLPEMTAMVRVRYRHGLLPHWQEIQDSFRDTILSFVVGQPKAQVAQ